MAHEGKLRRFESCGERVTVNCCDCLVSQTITKGKFMTIFNLEVSEYGISLQTYFGDLFLYHRAWITAIGLVAVLLVAKVMRKRNYEQREARLLSNPNIWS